MKIDKNTNVLIVGLGMIGGSYAKGLAKQGILANAIDIDEDTIRYAKERHIINQGQHNRGSEDDRRGRCDYFGSVSVNLPAVDARKTVVF